MAQRILICGGSSRLAYNWHYARHNHESIFLHKNIGDIEIKNAVYISINLESIEDILDKISHFKIDVMVNAVGKTSVDECEKDNESAYFINCILAKNLALASKISGIKFVHISTDHLFSGTQQFIPEDTNPEPLNYYGKSKAFAEGEVKNYCSEALIIRTNFFGWGPISKPSYSDWIISALKMKRNILVYSDVYFTPILATNLVNFIHALINLNARGIYNISSSERLSKYDFALKLAQISGLDSKCIEPVLYARSGQLVPRPLDMSLSNEKLKMMIDVPIQTIDSQLDELWHQNLGGIRA